MAKLGTVNAQFKLAANKNVIFTVLKNPHSELRDSKEVQENEYDYEASLAYLSLYTREVREQKSPAFTSDITHEPAYNQWIDSLKKLKIRTNEWQDVEVTLEGLPKSICTRINEVSDNIDDSHSLVKQIIREQDVNKKKEDIEAYKDILLDIQDGAKVTTRRLTDLFEQLREYSDGLNDDVVSFSEITNSIAKLSDVDQKKIDALIDEIKNYEGERAGYIAGASITGALGGAAIIGGAIAAFLVPEVGIIIGVCGLFAGGLLLTATGILAQKAVELKKKIEEDESLKESLQGEKAQLKTINESYKTLANMIQDAQNAMKIIFNNWQSVEEALNNISDEVSKLADGKYSEDMSNEQWSAVDHDLTVLGDIVSTITEPITALKKKTAVYLSCNFDKCESADDIIKVLEEAYKAVANEVA